MNEDNEIRTARGTDVIDTYASEMFGLTEDRNDNEMVAADLIADILHGAKSRGVKPAKLLKRAMETYEEDLKEGD